MLVVFTTDSNEIFYGGFNASYTSCLVLTSSYGTISSPNYPKNYNNFDSVCWIIRRPVGHIVSLTFSYFRTKEYFDYIRIFDGPSTRSRHLLSASGDTVPSDIISISNKILIVFSSGAVDVRNASSGYEVTFNSRLAG